MFSIRPQEASDIIFSLLADSAPQDTYSNTKAVNNLQNLLLLITLISKPVFFKNQIAQGVNTITPYLDFREGK